MREEKAADGAKRAVRTSPNGAADDSLRRKPWVSTWREHQPRRGGRSNVDYRLHPARLSPFQGLGLLPPSTQGLRPGLSSAAPSGLVRTYTYPLPVTPFPPPSPFH